MIDASTASNGQPADAGPSSRIIHFDATVRRKEKMRQIAVAGHEADAPAANGMTTAVLPQSIPAAAPILAPADSVVKPQPSVTASVAPAPTAAPPAPAAAAPSRNGSAASLSRPELEKFLVNFVVEQTGYPPEMVELDADLEADLGIDSIKKAQLFGELAEHLNIQVQIKEGMSLDDFPTLRHVMDFLAAQPSGAAAAAPPTVAPSVPARPQPSIPAQPAPVAAVLPAAPQPPAAPVAAAAIDAGQLETFMINFVVEQTGYPPEMVELDADLEADLGIDSIKKAQLFGELAEHLNIQVQIKEGMSLDDFPTLRHVLNFLASSVQQGTAKVGATNGAAVHSSAPGAPEPVAAMRPTAPLNGAAHSQPAAYSAAATAVAVAPAPAVAMQTRLSPAQLEQFLVNFVVEQTGYPPEMVELDADLEADLGIDSIKKAQLFGELAEHLNIQIQIAEGMSLDDFPTLRHVLNFLSKAAS